MKYLLSLCLALIGFSATAQTNVYIAPFVTTAKTKTTCGGPDYWFSGEAIYKPNQVAVSNLWYYTTTNILTISFTNNDALLDHLDNHGVEACGHGTVTWTNNVIPSRYRFTVLWSNNVALPPAGSLVPLTTVGFRTNSP